ncbi:MAG TPA: hypothetical protein PLG16_01415 [Planctomycetota bacterium]|nr:hypothetical protein [Planctomycetota bacterium]
MLWGGKCCSGEIILLWGEKLLWGENLPGGSKSCSGAKTCSGEAKVALGKFALEKKANLF